ncbi:MAG: hypothetical protein WCT22_02545 [Patescibacteria group bacterium]
MKIFKNFLKIKFLPLAITLISFFLIGLILINGPKTIKTSVVKIVERKNVNFDNVSSDTTPELSKPKFFYETERNRSYLKRLDISFQFFMPELKHGMNLFQTSNEGSGIRMEVQGPANLILQVRTRDSNEIVVPLSYTVSANKWYEVNLSIDESSKTTVIINNETVYSRIIRKMDYFIDDIAIGTGLSKSRNFDGIIKNFSIKYELLEPNFRSQIIAMLLPVSLILTVLVIVLSLLYLLYPNILKISNSSFYLLFLPLLFFLNIYLYSIRKSSYFYGDDIFVINFIENNFSLISLLVKSNGSFFRPILNLIYFIKYQLFGLDYNLWFYFNLIHSFINLLLIYCFTYLITKKNKFLAALIVVLVLVSQVRIWLYMWWPSIGTLNLFVETWSILCLIFLFLAYLNKSFSKYLISSGFYFLLVNTHESNIILTPLFLMFVFLEKDIFKSKLKKIIGVILPISISALYYFAKVYIAKTEFLVAASSGSNYKFNNINFFGSVVPTYLQYVLQFFNINFSKVAERGQMRLFSIDLLFIKVISITAVVGFIFITLFIIKKIFLKKEFFFYLFCFFILTLIPASLIPSQMELRWVENAYIVFVILFVLMSYQFTFNKKLLNKVIFFLLILFLFISNSYHFYNYYVIPDIKAIKIGSDGGMTEAIRLKENYGNSLKNYRIFFDIPGYFNPSFLFLDTFYSSTELFTAAFSSYDDIYINPINTKKNLVLKFDPFKQRYVDVTNDYHEYFASKQAEYNNLLGLPISRSTININSVLIEPRSLSLNIEGSITQSEKCLNDVYVFINNIFFTKIPFKSLNLQKNQCHFTFSIPRDRPPKEFELRFLSVEDNYSNSSFYNFDSEGNFLLQ